MADEEILTPAQRRAVAAFADVAEPDDLDDEELLSLAADKIGLTGELRPIHGLGRRLREAARLGFVRAIVPRQAGRGDDTAEAVGIEIVRVATLRDAIAAALIGVERAADTRTSPVPVGGGPS